LLLLFNSLKASSGRLKGYAWATMQLVVIKIRGTWLFQDQWWSHLMKKLLKS